MDLKFQKSFSIFLGVVLVLVNVVLLNVLIDRSGMRVRADLTDGDLYTINEVTREFLQGLERPAEIIFYHSSPKSMPPVVRPLVDPLRDAISELAIESGGKVRARFVTLDTEGKKAQEDAQDSYGVRPLRIPVSTATEDTIKSVYFAVVVTSGDQHEMIPLVPSPLVRIVEDHETFGVRLELTDPEYVLARALRKVVQTYGTVSGALIAQDLNVKLTAYLSADDALPENLRELDDTLRKVKDDLNEDAPGRFTLEIIDPWKDAKSVDEKQRAATALAQTVGVRPIRGPETDYYAWVLIESGGKVEAFTPQGAGAALGQADLKKSIEGSIERLIPGFLPTLGVVSPVPPMPPRNPMMPQQRPPDAFEATRQFLEREFAVEQVTLASGIGRGIDVLLVLQPGDLTDEEIYELDQFLMRGGRIVLCGGGFHGDLQAMMSRRPQYRVAPGGGFRLRSWLEHLGIHTEQKMLLDSKSGSISVPINMLQSVTVKYPFLLQFSGDRLSPDHPITAFQQAATMMWAAPVSLMNVPEGATGTVLMETSGSASSTSRPELAQSMLNIPYNPGLGPMGRIGSVVQNMWAELDYAVQREEPFPPAHLQAQTDWMLDVKTRQFSTAVAIEGEFTSYFADKPIPGTYVPDEAPKPGEEPKEKRQQTAPLDKSRRPGSIVVFGDADCFSWLAFRVYGMPEAEFEENMAMLTNALQWGSGDELAKIRSGRAPRRGLIELADLSPEERESVIERTQLYTFIITLGLVLFSAAGWMTWRRMRQPFTLLSESAARSLSTPLQPSAPTESGQTNGDAS